MAVRTQADLIRGTAAERGMVGQQEALRLFVELSCFSDARSYTVWPRAGERDSTLGAERTEAAGRVGIPGFFGVDSEVEAGTLSRSARRRDVDHVFGIGDWGERDDYEDDEVAAGTGRNGGTASPLLCSDELISMLESFDIRESFVKWITNEERFSEIKDWVERLKKEGWNGRDLQSLAYVASDKLSVDTHVDWIVVPRNNRGQTGHIAESLPLSAIVSLPSWWGQLKIVVKTCWIRPRHIPG